MIQDAFGEQRAILRPCGVRWLSRGVVLTRVLEQFDALKIYFRAQADGSCDDAKSDKSKASEICKVLFQPGTEHMLVFARDMITKVENVNRFLQGSGALLPLAEKSVNDVIKDISILLSSSSSKVTAEAEYLLLSQKLSDVGERQFRLDAHRFLRRLKSEIVKYIPTELLSLFAPLLPSSKAESLMPLLIRFKVERKTAVAVEDQFFSLKKSVNELVVENDDVVKFWVSAADVKDGTGNVKYPDLAQFVLGVIACPHSNAMTERGFSLLNRIKTSSTNRLTAENASARLVANQFAKQKSEASNEMLRDWISGGPYRRYREEAASKSALGLLADDEKSAQ